MSLQDAGTLVAALAVGAVIGVVTSFGQARLDVPWSALVNSASPWLLGGFVAGVLQRRPAGGAVAGLAACVLEVIAYYVTAHLRGYPTSDATIVFWVVCAVVGGPFFGWAGWAWARGPRRLRPWAASLVPATFLAEAVGSYGLRLHDHSTVLLFVVVGLGLGVLVTALSGPVRRSPVSLLAATAVAFVVGVAVYWQLLTVLAGGGFSA